MTDNNTNNTIFEFTAIYQPNETVIKEHYPNCNDTGQPENHDNGYFRGKINNPLEHYNIFKHIEAASEQINAATFNYSKEVNEVITKLIHRTFEHITLQRDEITKLQSRLQCQMEKAKQIQDSVKNDYYRYEVILENITEQMYNRKLMKRVLKNWHDSSGIINSNRSYNKVSDDSIGEHEELESIKNLENEISKLKSEKSVLLNSVKNAVTQGLSFITNETLKALDPTDATTPTNVKSPNSQNSSKQDDFTINACNQQNSVRSSPYQDISAPQSPQNSLLCSCNLGNPHMFQKNSPIGLYRQDNMKRNDSMNSTNTSMHCNCKSKFTSICCENVRQMHDFDLKHGDKNDSCLCQQQMFDNRLISDGPFSYDMNTYAFSSRFGNNNVKNLIPCYGKRPYLRIPHNKRKKKNMQRDFPKMDKIHKNIESEYNSMQHLKRTEDLEQKNKFFKNIQETEEQSQGNNGDIGKKMDIINNVGNKGGGGNGEDNGDAKAVTDSTISAREKLEKALFRNSENYECNSECCCSLQNDKKQSEEQKSTENINTIKTAQTSEDCVCKPVCDFRDNSDHNINSESKTQINYSELSNNMTRQQAKRQKSPKYNQFETKIDVASLKTKFQQEISPKMKTNANIKRMSTDCTLLEKCTYFKNISENSPQPPYDQVETLEYLNDFNGVLKGHRKLDANENTLDGNKNSSKRIFNKTDKNQKKKCSCSSVCTCPIWCTLDNIDEKVVEKVSGNTTPENSPRSENAYSNDCKCLQRGMH